MSHLTSGSPRPRPLACTLAPTVLGTHVERWTRLYADAGTERIETDNGLRVSFVHNATVENELRDLIAIEIECCRWADWSIQSGAETLTLAIASTGDGVDVIHTWLLDEPPSMPTPAAPPRTKPNRRSPRRLPRS